MDNVIANNKIILWADDDPDDLMLMRDVLKETGNQYEIIEVHNGKEALDYLRKCEDAHPFPSLIILDMNMPVLNGQETLARLKTEQTYDRIPVVIFTTSNSELDRNFCKKYHVDMITKPPEYKSLHEVVVNLLSYCKP